MGEESEVGKIVKWATHVLQERGFVVHVCSVGTGRWGGGGGGGGGGREWPVTGDPGSGRWCHIGPCQTCRTKTRPQPRTDAGTYYRYKVEILST